MDTGFTSLPFPNQYALLPVPNHYTFSFHAPYFSQSFFLRACRVLNIFLILCFNPFFLVVQCSFHFYYSFVVWRRASESARQVSLPVTCQGASVTQPDRLTWSYDHVGVATVERLDLKGSFHFLVSAPSSCRTGDTNSCPELGSLTKWLASRR
jgi:hypothetical protein